MNVIKLILLNPGINYLVTMVCCGMAVFTDANNAILIFISFCSVALNAITFKKGTKEFEEKWACLLMAGLMYFILSAFGLLITSSTDLNGIISGNLDIGKTFMCILIHILFAISLLVGNIVAIFHK